MMKINKQFYVLIATTIASCFVPACSSDDDESPAREKGNEKRLEMIVYTNSEGRVKYSDLFYYDDITGAIKRATRGDEQNVRFNISDNSITWYDDDITNTAKIVDGKAVHWVKKWSSGTPTDYYVSYDDRWHINQVDVPDYNESVFTLTWEGNNIKKFVKTSHGRKSYEIEYEYTKNKAHALAYHSYFNPFTEMDFLDCLFENGLFYTGACGQLSENLPSQAIFHTYWYEKKQSYTRTYSYIMDSEGYPVSVEIDGEREVTYYDSPVKMSITWGQSKN